MLYLCTVYVINKLQLYVLFVAQRSTCSGLSVAFSYPRMRFPIITPINRRSKEDVTTYSLIFSHSSLPKAGKFSAQDIPMQYAKSTVKFEYCFTKFNYADAIL
jgi:hypothetical protein